MYLLIVKYTQPVEVVAEHTDTHAVWVKKYFSENIFLAAGPKKEKNGGVIMAKSIARQELDRILEEDSFVKEKVASYDIIEFDCKLVSAGLELLQHA